VTRRQFVPRLTAGWLAIPPSLYLLIFFVAPLGILIQQSLFLPEFSIEKYANLFTVAAFSRGLVNSLELAGSAALITALLGALMIVALHRASGRTRALLVAMLLMPFAANELVRIVSWIIFLSPAGPVNGVLQTLPFVEGSISLVKNRAGVLIGLVHVLLPFFVLTAYSATRAVDWRLVRAAESLGARPLTAFLSVFVPLALPGLTAAMLLVFVLALGYYATPAALGGPGDTVLPTLIATRVRDTVDWGQAAALGVLLLGVTAVVLVLIARLGGLRVLYATSSGPTVRSSRLAGLWYSLVASRALIAFAEIFVRLPVIVRILRRLHIGAVSLIVAYLLTPVLVAIPASLTAGRLLRLPPDGLSLRWYEDFFSRGAWTEGSLTSIQIAVAVGLITVGLALAAAVGLVRGQGRARSELLAFYLLPLIMPSIVTALAMFLFFVRIGLAYTPPGIALGHVVFAFPYALLVIVAAVQAFDWQLDRAAQASGAKWYQRLRDVMVPLLRPAILSGLLFAFIASFTELVFALFMHSLSITTLPVTMWDGIRYSISPTTAAAASLIIIVIASAFAVHLGFRGFARIRQDWRQPPAT
jgi:putative spermidine/putrescine transport system permease protein